MIFSTHSPGCTAACTAVCTETNVLRAMNSNSKFYSTTATLFSFVVKTALALNADASNRCIAVGGLSRLVRLLLSQISFIHGFNTLRPRQNGRLFADDTFKRIFLKENVRISIKISLKFVPKVPINNIPSLF